MVLLIATDAVVLHDDVRQVGVVDRVELHVGVAVDEVVQVLRAQGEGADHLAGVQLLSRPGDAPGPVQVDDAVGHHLGMDAEVRTPGFPPASAQTAFGMPPMPICRQAPSSISAAISRATALSTSVAGAFGSSAIGPVVALDDVVHLAHMHPGPVAHAPRQGRGLLDDHHLAALDQRAHPQACTAPKLK